MVVCARGARRPRLFDDEAIELIIAKLGQPPWFNVKSRTRPLSCASSRRWPVSESSMGVDPKIVEDQPCGRERRPAGLRSESRGKAPGLCAPVIVLPRRSPPPTRFATSHSRGRPPVRDALVAGGGAAARSTISLPRRWEDRFFASVIVTEEAGGEDDGALVGPR